MTTSRSALVLILLASCGAPPPTPPSATPGGGEGPATTPAAGKQIPCAGVALLDSREDPYPRPEEALVVDGKPWDIGYEPGKFGGTLVISAFSDPKTFNFITAN